MQVWRRNAHLEFEQVLSTFSTHSYALFNSDRNRITILSSAHCNMIPYLIIILDIQRRHVLILRSCAEADSQPPLNTNKTYSYYT